MQPWATTLSHTQIGVNKTQLSVTHRHRSRLSDTDSLSDADIYLSQTQISLSNSPKNTSRSAQEKPRGTQDRDKTATRPRVSPHRYPSPTQRSPSGPIVPGLLASHIYETSLILCITVFEHNSETTQILCITLFKYSHGNILCLSVNACTQEDICIYIYIYKRTPMYMHDYITQCLLVNTILFTSQSTRQAPNHSDTSAQ